MAARPTFWRALNSSSACRKDLSALALSPLTAIKACSQLVSSNKLYLN